MSAPLVGSPAWESESVWSDLGLQNVERIIAVASRRWPLAFNMHEESMNDEMLAMRVHKIIVIVPFGSPAVTNLRVPRSHSTRRMQRGSSIDRSAH